MAFFFWKPDKGFHQLHLYGKSDLWWVNCIWTWKTITIWQKQLWLWHCYKRRWLLWGQRLVKPGQHLWPAHVCVLPCTWAVSWGIPKKRPWTAVQTFLRTKAGSALLAIWVSYLISFEVNLMPGVLWASWESACLVGPKAPLYPQWNFQMYNQNKNK